MPNLAEVVAALERRYPPETAVEWDAVGLVTGDPGQEAGRVHFAVDPTLEVADEAVELGASLLVTHHPLFLEPVHGVPATDPRAQVVLRLARAGVAHYVAHTNADAAWPGVSDALARAIGLVDVAALPGEESGMGRIGRLPEPLPLEEFARHVAAGLPETAGGVLVSGAPGHLVGRVACCGGSGGSMWPAVAAAGVDVYVTADLGHHRAGDARAGGVPALVDVAHWASEWPWLQQAADLLSADVDSVSVSVSGIRTDPWTWQGSSR